MEKKIVSAISFGVDYYPEHWPKERWPKDIQLMKELGVQVVRLGEFSWSKFEPEAGNYQFAWLDEAIEMMKEAGIYTVLGTPTAAPPAWLIKEDETILPMDENGIRKGFGGRHHDCQSNANYRRAIGKLVTAMAEHYKEESNVIGWQIDNELGNSHEKLCMCPSCQKSFQQWLKEKYHTIENLNHSWGTVFWSQEYQDFYQIPVPKVTPTMHNPSLELDWKRFCSDLVNDFLAYQAKIVKNICPDKFITHNLMGFYDKTDYFKMGEYLDFAGNDQYPTGYYFQQPGQPPFEVASCYDFIRSVKDKPFWMIEMQAGATGGKLIGRTPKPGQLGLWTAQSVAHGADTIIYFRWRTCLFGTEQYWHGILPHSGIPGRTYEELKEVMALLRPAMEEVKGIVSKSKAAILFSYEQDWAMQVQPHNPQYSYLFQVQQMYRWCYEAGISVDFKKEGDSLLEYDLVFAPVLYLSKTEQKEQLEAYVSQGGHLVMTFRSGVKDEQNVCLPETLPGPYGKLAGIEIPEYDCLWEETITLLDETGEAAEIGSMWSDRILPKEASAVRTYETGMYKGEPAVTVNEWGKGKVWYLGCVLKEGEEKLIHEIIQQAGLNLGQPPNKEIEWAVREGHKADYLFLMNHTEKEQTLCLWGRWGRQEVTLEPYGVKLIRKEREDSI